MKNQKGHSNRKIIDLCFALCVIFVFFMMAFVYLSNLRNEIAKTDQKIADLQAITPSAYYEKAKKELINRRAELEEGLDSYPSWAR